MHLDLTLELLGFDPPWGRSRVRHRKQDRPVDLMNYAAEPGHPTGSQMTNMILHRERGSALDNEQIIGTVVGQEGVAFGPNYIDSMRVKRARADGRL